MIMVLSFPLNEAGADNTMDTLNFKCPECNNLFSFKVDYVPDGCAIVQDCPFCHELIKLTSDNVVDEPAVVILDLDGVCYY